MVLCDYTSEYTFSVVKDSERFVCLNYLQRIEVSFSSPGELYVHVLVLANKSKQVGTVLLEYSLIHDHLKAVQALILS